MVPATNRPETLLRCLSAVTGASEAPDEVIVIRDPPGLGPAAARNLGATRATGDILVFVDADVVVHADAFSRIRAAFAESPELSAVFGSYDDRPSRHGVVSTFRNTLHHHVHQGAPGSATTFWAGLGAVRREAFVAVDGFDDWRFRVPSVEDIDLGLRLAVAGGHIRLDPAIQATHLKQWRLQNMMVTDVLRRGTPWTAMMLDYGSRAAKLNVRGPHLASVGAICSGILAGCLGHRRIATSLLTSYVAINSPFYGLMARSAGRRAAAASVGLLVAHNAAALSSLPLGLMRFSYERVRRARPGIPLARHAEASLLPAAPVRRAGGRFARHG